MCEVRNSRRSNSSPVWGCSMQRLLSRYLIKCFLIQGAGDGLFLFDMSHCDFSSVNNCATFMTAQITTVKCSCILSWLTSSSLHCFQCKYDISLVIEVSLQAHSITWPLHKLVGAPAVCVYVQACAAPWAINANTCVTQLSHHCFTVSKWEKMMWRHHQVFVPALLHLVLYLSHDSRGCCWVLFNYNVSVQARGGKKEIKGW